MKKCKFKFLGLCENPNRELKIKENTVTHVKVTTPTYYIHITGTKTTKQYEFSHIFGATSFSFHVTTRRNKFLLFENYY